MPRIPTRQVEDDWNDYNDDEPTIEHDEPRDRHGRRLPKEDKQWEEQRRRQWRRADWDDR